MRPGRYLHAGRGELPGGGSVHDDFRALWIGIHLRPGDTGGRLFGKDNRELRLDVVLYLNGPGVRLISLQPQDEVVLAGRERERNRGLTRLFRSVNENISSRRLTADENALSQRFEFDLLVLRIAALYLQSGLNGLIAFLLHFQAVARRRQIEG